MPGGNSGIPDLLVDVAGKQFEPKDDEVIRNIEPDDDVSCPKCVVPNARWDKDFRILYQNREFYKQI